MTRRLITFRLPEDLVSRVDTQAQELGQTRTMFLVRALERALDAKELASSTARAPSLPKAQSAPPRAPKKDDLALDYLKKVGLTTGRSSDYVKPFNPQPKKP